MAFEQLKSVITTQIKTNGIESITGAIMQSVLLQMVDELGEWTDTEESPYATQDWVSTQLLGYATTAALGAKQDQLVSGTNIKTINNQSILGSGNIDIQGGGGGNYLPITGGTLLGDLNIASGYKLGIMYSEDLGMSKYNYWNSYLGHNNLKFTYLGYGEQSERTPLELVYRPVLNGYSILEVTGRVKSFGFSTPYGTSSQFLKADGSIDSSQYVTSSQCLMLTGGTMTGDINFSNGNYGNTIAYYNTAVRQGGINFNGYGLLGLDAIGKILLSPYTEDNGVTYEFGKNYLQVYFNDHYYGNYGDQLIGLYHSDGDTTDIYFEANSSGITTERAMNADGYLTIGGNILHKGNTEFLIGRNNNGVIDTSKARLRLTSNVAELYSGLSFNYFGLDSGGNFHCSLYDALVIQDHNDNNKNILLYSNDEYGGALRTDCDFMSQGALIGVTLRDVNNPTLNTVRIDRITDFFNNEDAAKYGFGKGVCSTAASTAAKVVNITDFNLVKNGMISVRFDNAINIPNATLNVSGTGAKPITINGAALQYGVIHAGMTAIMQYDGTNWDIVSLMGLEKGGVGAHLVDLGLPSGLLWAASNIDISQADGFAVSPADAGSYFSWGNNEGHNPVNSSFVNVYDWGTGVDTAPYKDSIGAKVTANLSPQMDMARANLGAPWRLPSRYDFQELYDNCTWTWGTLDGKNGYTVLATNGNSIFLPAAGYGNGTSLYHFGSYGLYWSSSFNSSTGAYGLYFYSGGINPQHIDGRYRGFSVRAVQ